MTVAPTIPVDPDIASRPTKDADAITERRQQAATVWVYRNNDWINVPANQVRADERYRLSRPKLGGADD